MSQVAAMTALFELLSSVYPEAEVLHPDDDATFQEVVKTKTAVRFYHPQLLESGYLPKWLCVVDVAALTSDAASSEGDKLLQRLITDPGHDPKPQLKPEARTFREVGFGRCNIQFQLITG